MNPLNPSILAAIVLFARIQGRDKAVRALTLSQSTIRSVPGRRNQDVVEIQRQAAQVAEQTVQLAEAIYTRDWTDPDLEAQADDRTLTALNDGLESHNLA